ncbi:Fc.00g108140.m01.CDS01 [Cosmosporella sp. VM-42]
MDSTHQDHDGSDQARALSQVPRKEEKSHPTGFTYRVRGVPLDWDMEQLQSFFAGQLSSDGPMIKSLAGEINGRSQTATITFNNLPSQLQTRSANQNWNIELPKESEVRSRRSRYITLDRGFLGITTLFTPMPEDHRVDVIAISGLGGHAFGSFKQRGEDYMWLRDAIPYDIIHKDTDNEMARVMIYGYESGIPRSKKIQNLEDLGTSFRDSLLPLANTPTTRPIVLVAHSLGGLIVKQTLISLSKSKKEDDVKLLKLVYGIVFFGVPHDGMDVRSLIPMVGDGPNRFLIESISHINSQILSIQQREFHDALGGQDESTSEIFCFYETEESKTAQEDERGNWSMNGPEAVLVTKSSATHCRSWESGTEHICAVARSHSEMVKFEPHDDEYEKVCERLKGLVRRALLVQHRIRDSTAKFLVPYTKNHNFVHRPGVLNDLKQQLGYGQRQSACKPLSRVALFGLGGVGKTQVAIAYVYWLQEKFPDVSVFWVHASNPDRFQQAYMSIAKECSIPGHDDPEVDVLELVKSWLENKYRSPWLMVIDNADDTHLFVRSQQEVNQSNLPSSAIDTAGNLGRYIPSCSHGSILITSRNKQAALRLAPESPLIEVGRMTEDEADQLVQKMLLASEMTTQEITDLATHLEYLPLALAQAVAFIRENTITIGAYIQLLEESDLAIANRLSEPFEAVGRDSDTPHALALTWIISFEQIEQRHAVASEVLSLISFFDRQDIPKDFVVAYLHKTLPQGSEEQAELTKALGTLKAFLFISEGGDRSVDMHRLVQLVTRKWLLGKGRVAEFSRHALSILSVAYPFGRFENRDVCRKYLPHANAVLKNPVTGGNKDKLAKATLLHNVAGHLKKIGSNVAVEYLKEAVALRREALGDENLWTAQSMGNLGVMYQELGRWDEAEEIQKQALEIKKRVRDENHPDTFTNIKDLASIYNNQGRWKEGEELGLQVIESKKRVLGEEHPLTLISMNNLAITYERQGQYDKAEKLNMEVLEMKRRLLGEKHPETLTSMNNLAIACKSRVNMIRRKYYMWKYWK